MEFSGVFSVLPTPFDGQGKVDTAGLRRVVEQFLTAGVNGFTALGVTSEAARLTEVERAQALDTVLKAAAGRVPIVAGTTADGLHACLELSRQAKAAGAAALMISPPRAPKLNSDAVVAHYRAVADAVDLPIVVQDYPPISGFAMEAALLARIAKEVERARVIKLEDPPTPPKIAKIVALAAADGVPVRIFGGLGGVFLFEEMLAGSAGAMTGFAYPEALVEIVSKYRGGDVEAAAQAFYRYVPLLRFEFQEGVGLAIRKDVLRRRGLIADASVRAPASPLDKGTAAALERVLAWTKQQGAAWISV